MAATRCCVLPKYCNILDLVVLDLGFGDTEVPWPSRGGLYDAHVLEIGYNHRG